MPSPAFPQCVHRFGAIFAQVIHMLSTAKPAVNFPAVCPDPARLLCFPAAHLPGEMRPPWLRSSWGQLLPGLPGSGPVLGAPFVPVLSDLGCLGRIARH
jgi:hypothetical protein